jgi:small-conductance mechanosensitive channel
LSELGDLLAPYEIWLWWIAGIALAISIGTLVHRAIFLAIERIDAFHLRPIRIALLARVKKPTRIIFPLLAIIMVMPLLPSSDAEKGNIQHIAGLIAIALIGWGTLIAISFLEDLVAARYSIDEHDNLRARSIRTQSQMLRRVSAVIITVITIGFMLMTFPEIRRLGLSLFASAGIAGLIIGMAARPALSNLIAGLQIALTEPIRIDDVVIVEGEWGRIEEIGTTYVVIKIWDLRRMVVPLSYFIEKPFQNWTRVSADILGSVFLYTDYTVPVEALREELTNILKSTKLWDGTVNVLQMSDAKEHTIEIRALMSARNSSDQWDLRCFVRERLIAFLQKNYPEALPRTRAEFQPVRDDETKAEERRERNVAADRPPTPEAAAPPAHPLTGGAKV